jgi:hypothetical protein
VTSGREWREQGERAAQESLLLFEPLVGLLILALGTVTILAGVIAVALRLALRAVIELAAESLGAALFNVAHGAAVRGQQLLAELLPVGSAMQPEDVSQFQH